MSKETDDMMRTLDECEAKQRSVWIIERVFLFSAPVPLAMVAICDEQMARAEVKKLKQMYGGDMRAVEYRRVPPPNESNARAE